MESCLNQGGDVKTRKKLFKELECDELEFIEKKCERELDEKCVETVEKEKKAKRCKP